MGSCQRQVAFFLLSRLDTKGITVALEGCNITIALNLSIPCLYVTKIQYLVCLRLEDTYGARIRPPLHVSFNNYVIRPSIKNLRDNFLTKWPRMCVYIFKVNFKGRAEIKNGRICLFLDTFNFSSESRGHFSNVNILFTSLATFLSPPVRMHGGLICIAFCLYGVT